MNIYLPQLLNLYPFFWKYKIGGKSPALSWKRFKAPTLEKWFYTIYLYFNASWIFLAILILSPSHFQRFHCTPLLCIVLFYFLPRFFSHSLWCISQAILLREQFPLWLLSDVQFQRLLLHISCTLPLSLYILHVWNY